MRKRCLSVVLTIALVLGSLTTGYAQEVSDDQTVATESTEELSKESENDNTKVNMKSDQKNNKTDSESSPTEETVEEDTSALEKFLDEASSTDDDTIEELPEEKSEEVSSNSTASSNSTIDIAPLSSGTMQIDSEAAKEVDTVSPNSVSYNNLWSQLTYSGKQATIYHASDGKYYAVAGTKVFVGTDATSSSKLIKVNKKGIASIKKPGTASLTSSTYGDVDVTIIKPKISEKKATITVGGAKQLSLSGVPAGMPVAWYSQNQNIVQVLSGNCVGVGVGKSKVYAYVGGKSYAANIKVTDKANSTIIINATAGGKAVPIKGIKGVKKATLDVSGNGVSYEKGKITASTAQKASISANLSDGHSVRIYVNDATPKSTTYNIKTGEMVPIFTENYHEFTDWKSKDPKIAVISEYGVLVGQSPGTTTIKGKFGGKNVKIEVNVSSDIYKGTMEGAYTPIQVIDPINGLAGSTLYVFEHGKVTTTLEEPKSDEGDTPIGTVYDVSFNTNGGTEIKTQQVPAGETAKIPNNPNKSDAVFNGWMQGNYIYDFDTPVNQDITLTAGWLGDYNNDGIQDNIYGEDELVALVFDFNGGHFTNFVCDDVATQYVTKGDYNVAQYIPVKEGYTFKGWHDFDGNLCTNINIQEDTLLVAYWEDSDGNLLSDTSSFVLFNDNIGHVYERPILEGGTVTPPTISNPGNNFIGWFYDNGRQYTNADTFTAPTILYASWTPTNPTNTDKFYVKFRPMNESDSFGFIVNYNTRVNKPRRDPTWEGHSFLGWFKGDNLFNFSNSIKTDTTLTANWDEGQYTIHYNSNGGSGSKADATLGYSQYVTLTGDGFRWAGHTLLGYDTDRTATTPTYSLNSRVRDITRENEVTLYCIWAAEQVGYTVTHRKMNLDGSTYAVADTESKQAVAGTQVTPAVKSYPGFTAPSTQTVTVDDEGNTNVIYDYTRNQYEVTETHDANIASVTGAGTYYYGAEVTLTANPKASESYTDYVTNGSYRYKGGKSYSFVKWEDNSTNATRTFTMPAENVSCSATGTNEVAKVDEQFKLSIRKDAHITSVTPDVGDYWYDKGEEVDVLADYPANYVAVGTGHYVMNRGYNVNVSSILNNITITWDDPLSDYGEYLGEFTGTHGDASTVGHKTIRYTDTDGNTAYANPYEAGSITIMPGTKVVYIVIGDEDTGYKAFEYETEFPVSGKLIKGEDTDGSDCSEDDPGFVPEYIPNSPDYITLTWDEALSQYGEYLGDFNGDHGESTQVGWKNIRYTTPDGDTAFADPYQPGSINIKPGTKVTFRVVGDEETDYKVFEYDMYYPVSGKIIPDGDTDGHGLSDENPGFTPGYIPGSNPEVTLTTYKVIHEKMNVDGSTYSTAIEQEFYYIPYKKVTPSTKTFTGFTAPSTQTVTVAADGSTEVTYQYTRNQYNLTVTAGSLIESVTGSGTYYFGQTVNVTATPKSPVAEDEYTEETGYRYKKTHTYTFRSWNISGSDRTSANLQYVMPSEDITLTATGKDTVTKSDEQYLLTVNKGTHVATVTGAGWYDVGATATVDATYEDGYEAKTGTGNYIMNSATTVTVTAKTTGYEITYDLDGGTVATANPEDYNAETPTFTLNNPTRTGYTFKGWSGTELTGDTNLTVTITAGSIGDREYTANWTPNNYNVDLEDNTTEDSYTISWSAPLSDKSAYLQSSTDEGAKQIAYTTVNGVQAFADPYQSGTITIQPGTEIHLAMKAGFSIGNASSIHWSVGNSSVDPKTEHGGVVFTSSYKPTHSGTLTVTTDTETTENDGKSYAWVVSFTEADVPINYHKLTWAEPLASSGEYLGTNDITSPTDEQVGKKRIKYTTSAGTTAYANPYEAGFINFQKDTTVYLETVTNGNDGGKVAWHVNDADVDSKSASNISLLSSAFTPTGNSTLTLNSEDNSTATWIVNCVTYPVTTQVTYDSTYGVLGAPARMGYDFDGWYTTPNGGTQVGEDTQVTIVANQTLYAHWTPRNDTPVTVVHQQQKLDGTYETTNTEAVLGTSGEELTPEVETVTGFTSPEPTTLVVNPNGTSQIIYRYTRNRYQIDPTAMKGEYIDTVTATGNVTTPETAASEGYLFGETVTLVATPIGATTEENYTYADDKTATTGDHRWKKKHIYSFDQWSDGDTNATRDIIVDENPVNLVAGGEDDGGVTKMNEEFLLTLVAGENVTKVFIDPVDDPAIVDYRTQTDAKVEAWIKKGESVNYDCTIRESWTEDEYTIDPEDPGHRYKITHNYTFDRWHDPDSVYVLNWTSPLATVGSYDANLEAGAANVNKKRIVYTDEDDNTKYANPYQAGSIEVKRGTPVKFEIVGSSPDNNYVSIVDNEQSTLGSDNKEVNELMSAEFTPTRDIMLFNVDDFSTDDECNWCIMASDPLTLSWSSPLSTKGTYDASLVTGDGKAGNKRIKYTNSQGETAYANPYEAGSITVLPGSAVILQMIPGTSTETESDLCWYEGGSETDYQEGKAPTILNSELYPTHSGTLSKRYDELEEESETSNYLSWGIAVTYNS